MLKRLFLVLLLFPASLFAGTITAQANGNWSDSGTWNGGVAPAANDTASLGNFAVVMNVATIPAGGGSLTAITAGSGQLTVALDAATFHGGAAINAVTITAGTNATGVISVTGTATEHVLTISNGGAACTINGGGTSGYGVYTALTTVAAGATVNIVGSVNGGTGTTSRGVYVHGAHTLNITGSVTGGSNTNAVGVFTDAVSAITITGNVTGGTGQNANGIYNSSTGALTVIGNMIDGTGGGAYAGRPPTWTYAAANYHQLVINGSTTVKFVQQMDDGLVLEGTTYGDRSGAYHVAATTEVKDGIMFGDASGEAGTYSPGGTFTEGQANQLSTDQGVIAGILGSILESQTNILGLATNDGTYHVAAAAEVKSGVTFGAASAETGTYSPGGTYAEGAAAQLVTDKAAVQAATASILDSATILTHTGTYHAPSASEVWHTAVFGDGSGTQGTKRAGYRYRYIR